jgi:hypothetical protein
VTRRQLLVALGSLAGGLAAAPARIVAAPSRRARGRRRIYRLSSSGRRASTGTRAHHANFRFRTRRAADLGRAHPGDDAKIVPLDVSVEEFHRLFPRGQQFVDLRKIGGPRRHERRRRRRRR